LIKKKVNKAGPAHSLLATGAAKEPKGVIWFLNLINLIILTKDIPRENVAVFGYYIGWFQIIE
jgi:hypothetical protein